MSLVTRERVQNSFRTDSSGVGSASARTRTSELTTDGASSSSSLVFTLPISCQICLSKVKDPVICSNRHVFCKGCMDMWLQRIKQCPACRVDITEGWKIYIPINWKKKTENFILVLDEVKCLICIYIQKIHCSVFWAD